MDKSIIGNKLNAGFNALKRVAAAPAEAKEAKTAAKFSTDAVSLGQVQTPARVGGAIADAQLAAELRLAKAYDPDPVKFSQNMIRASLEDIVSNIG